MSDLRNVMKSGWHPKGKDGGKESWRGDFKGINQVAGWMGKGKKPGESGGSEHISRPLTTLKDPSLFGPPPKNVNYHGGAALPNQITPHTGGVGAPLSNEEIESARRATHEPSSEEVDEEQKRVAPPLPYRADRTGLNTSHLPPPLMHRNIASPPATTATQPAKPKPGLPPRLPSRQNTVEALSHTSSPPPPTYEAAQPPAPPPSRVNGSLNQSAINRLGKAGISVPGFGIGNHSSNNTTTSEPNPWKNEASQSTSPNPQTSQPAASNLSEFQARFARMTADPGAPAPSTPSTAPNAETQSPPATDSPQVQNQSTTWAQKQAALRTASNLHQNPSTVTLSDAQSAASTANNFRQRHGATVAAAGVKANAWNKKYNVTGRLNSYISSPTSETAPAAPTQQQQSAGLGGAPMMPQTQGVVAAGGGTASPELTASISRKPPPPPPPKKPEGMHGTGNGAPPPPPVPLGTKPSYS